MPIPAALKLNGGLNVIDRHHGSGPEICRQSHTAQFPGLDQPRRGEAEKMHLCAANSAGEPGTPYSAR